MADTKISNLPAVVAPLDTDEYAVNQGGTTKKITRAQIFDRTVSRQVWIPAVTGYDHTAVARMARTSEHGWEAPLDNNSDVFGDWIVPEGFTGSLVIAPVFIGLAGAGNVTHETVAFYGACGEDHGLHTASGGLITTIGIVNDLNHCFGAATLAVAAVGDIVRLYWNRDGPNVLDTYNNTIYMNGFYATYDADF